MPASYSSSLYCPSFVLQNFPFLESTFDLDSCGFLKEKCFVKKGDMRNKKKRQKGRFLCQISTSYCFFKSLEAKFSEVKIIKIQKKLLISSKTFNFFKLSNSKK